MEKKNNMLIESLVKKAYLIEEAEPKKPEELDKMITTIRTTSLKLKEELIALGVQEKSNPINILTDVYNLLAEFDPVSNKILNNTKYMQSDASQAMQDVVSETKKTKKVKYYGL
jgi:hypothetical protein